MKGEILLKVPLKIQSFVLVFFLFAITPSGSSADTHYTVRKGDSLYKIARAFKVDAGRIREANGLASSSLRPGTRLTIPSRKEGAKKSIPSAAEKASSKAASDLASQEQKESSSGDIRYHTVKKGDSLSSISKKYSVSVEELKELNNIRQVKRLKTGQHLLVKRTGPRTYTVKKGDNIWKIAKKFNMSVEDIEELNALEPGDLRPGRKLLLEEWTERSEKNAYSPVISQAKIAEDLKDLSESPELETLSMKERVTLFARKMLNIPYKFGGSSFMGIDCSGYVQKVFSFLDVPLPRSAREQFHIGQPVNKEDLSIGDLVFFRTYASFPSHVGIYLGNNLFIHASSKGKKVTIDSLDTPYYIKRFIGAKRLISDEQGERETTKKEG